MKPLNPACVDVFISYSSKNKSVADAVVSDFEQNGIRCWYAPRDIIPGTEWVTAIKDGIHSAKVFVLLFTEESNTSRQVMNEVAMAFNAEKTIVPFKLTKEEMNGELEYYLTRVHWLDAVSEPLNAHIVELRKFVELILTGTGQSNGGNANGRVGNTEDVAGQVIGTSKAAVRLRILAGAGALLIVAGILLLILKPFGSGSKNTGTEGDNKEQNKTQTVTPTVTQEPKDNSGMYDRGEAYFQKGDYDNALDCFLKALDGGDTRTALYYRLGTIYLAKKADGAGNEEKALQYLELAYHDGNGETLTADEYYLLAYKYDSDPEVSDPAKVCRFAREGAEAGSIPCMLMLGEAYWYGNGVNQDYSQVLAWFGRAIDSGAEGYSRKYCLNAIATLVDEGHVTREAAAKWLDEGEAGEP